MGKRKTIDSSEKLAYTQELFRILLSNGAAYYFSFCEQDIYDDDCHWHCQKCQKCRSWREWHCHRCNKCTYFGRGEITELII